MEFILSDENVNRKGYRVNTSGIKIDSFNKNPVMLYNHKRNKTPIGKWKIRKEGNTLLGEPEFDENDEFAQQIKSKVENGYINATSIGFDVMAISEDEKDLEKGQTRPTVTRSELLEVSFVDIPGNANAVKLHFPNKGLTLSGDVSNGILDAVLPEIDNQQNEREMDTKELAKKLGLSENATEEQINDKIAELQNPQQTPPQPKRQDEPQKNEGQEALVENALSWGEQQNVVKKDNKESWRKALEADFQNALSLMKEQMPGKKESITDAIKEVAKLNNGNAGGEERSGWTYLDWMKKDPEGLENLKKNKPEEFNTLREKARELKQ